MGHAHKLFFTIRKTEIKLKLTEANSSIKDVKGFIKQRANATKNEITAFPYLWYAKLSPKLNL